MNSSFLVKFFEKIDVVIGFDFFFFLVVEIEQQYKEEEEEDEDDSKSILILFVRCDLVEEIVMYMNNMSSFLISCILSIDL